MGNPERGTPLACEKCGEPFIAEVPQDVCPTLLHSRAREGAEDRLFLPLHLLSSQQFFPGGGEIREYVPRL